MAIDTFNKHFVGSQGDKILIMNPPRSFASYDEALVFAAWIVVQADPEGERFKEILAAVSNS